MFPHNVYNCSNRYYFMLIYQKRIYRDCTRKKRHSWYSNNSEASEKNKWIFTLKIKLLGPLRFYGFKTVNFSGLRFYTASKTADSNAAPLSDFSTGRFSRMCMINIACHHLSGPGWTIHELFCTQNLYSARI